MAQALQPLSGLPGATSPSWRMRIAHHGDVEASAYPGGIDCTVEDEASQVVGSQAAGRVPDFNATLSTVNSGEREGSISTLIFASTWIFTKATEIVSAGIFPASHWCRYLFHCAPVEGVADQSWQSEYSVQWEVTLTSIARSWKDTQSIATSLLVVSALAILQLDGALSDRAICNGIAASIQLALASILSSFVYLLSKQRFISRWKTSETPDGSFWRCVGMPLDFAVWSFGFFISALSIFIHKRMLPTMQTDAPIDHPTINSPKTSGAIVVIVLTLLSACKIYYGLFFLLRCRTGAHR